MISYEYIREPEEIYRRSAELVKGATDVSGIPAELHDMVYRLVHACGMPDIVDELAWHESPARSGARALGEGSVIIADCEMVVNGIIRSRLPADNPVICTLNDMRVEAIRSRDATTRSAAAVELWQDHLDNAVVAIGNAPTALFRLLECLSDKTLQHKPAVVLAFPVGFVGAAESKAALIAAELGIPFITLRGRRGGSAMAAAAVNALSGSLVS